MRPLYKILLIVILVPLLIVGGLKGYMHYRLQNAMETLQRQSVIVGKLEWTNLSTSLSGKLGVHGISFAVRDTDEIIHIKSIYYTPPNLWFLFKSSDALKQGRIPEQMQLEIEAFNMDLYGDLTTKVEDIINALNAGTKGINKLCGGRLFIGPKEYREMGYEEITMDMRLAYQLDHHLGQLIVDIDELVHNMGASQIRLTVTGVNDNRMSRLMAMETLPRLDRVSLRYEDRSYFQRLVETCAQKSNLTKAEYIEAEGNQKPSYFAYIWGGIVPGEGLRDAYKRFLHDPQSIDVSLLIPEEVNLESLDLFAPADIPNLLSLNLNINGEPVQDLSFSFYEGELPDLSDRIGHALLSEEEQAQVVKPKKKIIKPTKYYKVSVKSLSKYKGKHARIITDSGKKREGTIKRVSGNTLYLVKKLHGGTLEMTVPISRVKKAEVLK